MSTSDEIFDTLHTRAEGSEGAGGTRVSAALVKRGKILAFGKNKKKSHPFAALFSKNPHAIYPHAELDAIMQAKKNGYSEKDIAGATMYVLRLRYTDRSKATSIRANARPCPGCRAALRKHDIYDVWYTNDSGFPSKMDIFWHCNRCGERVRYLDWKIDNIKPCNCNASPSPWIPKYEDEDDL